METRYDDYPEAGPVPKKKHTGLVIAIIASVLIVCVGMTLVILMVIIPGRKYAKGEKLLADGEYEEATAVFEALGDFKDSPYMVNKCQYKYGVALYEDGEFKKAMKVFKALGDFKDSEDQVEACEEAIRNRAYTAACGLYKAETAEYDGITVNVDNFFEKGFTIELKSRGKCKLFADGKTASGKWTLDGTAFHVNGGGIDCDGTLENGVIRLDYEGVIFNMVKAPAE